MTASAQPFETGVRSAALPAPESLLPRGMFWARPLRGVWRTLLKAKREYLRAMRFDSAPRLERVRGRPFIALPSVFNPKIFRSSEFLARMMDSPLVPTNCEALDMGCGSGVGAVFAAQRAGKVTAVDINPEAVRCARLNAALNRVEERCEFLESDVFDSLEGRRFDVVLFNPPFFVGAPKDAAERAWRGVDVLERFAGGLADHLKPGGSGLVVFSSDGELAALICALQSHNLRVELLAEEDLINEVLVLYRVRAPERDRER